MPKKPIKREYSAGGVVFKKENDQTLWLLIKPKDTDRWQLPKGLIDKKEKGEETAKREVEEETGIKAEIAGKAETIQYFYHFQGQKIQKTVQYYLMACKGGKIVCQEQEIDEARFFPYKEAYQNLTFENEKRALEKAKKLLETGEVQLKLVPQSSPWD